MSTFKVEQLEEHLRELRRVSPNVIGSSILSTDGWPIAADLPETLTDEDHLAAKSAAMMLLGERISGELGRGGLEMILMSGSAGHIIVAAINEAAALTVMCNQKARLAMVFIDITHCIERLVPLLWPPALPLDLDGPLDRLDLDVQAAHGDDANEGAAWQRHG
jgi:uncharacterized protein